MDSVRDRIRGALLLIAGVIESPGIFGEGDAFWVNGKQIGNRRSEHEIELRLTKAVIRTHRDRLSADGRVRLRRSSDWVTITVAGTSDVPLVEELAELAARAHRPADGAPEKPPPVGAELARRRRFH